MFVYVIIYLYKYRTIAYTLGYTDDDWLKIARLNIFSTLQWCESNTFSGEIVLPFWILSLPGIVMWGTALSRDAGSGSES